MCTIGVHETGELLWDFRLGENGFDETCTFPQFPFGRFLWGAREIVAEGVEPRLKVGDEVVA